MLGRLGLVVAFLWGLAEATFFFVIPDVLLSFVAMLDWRSTWRHIVAALAGAVLGGALLFQWSQADPEAAHAAVARVPFITPGMFAKVNSGFDKMGLLAVLAGSVSGIPYKLYAVEAPRVSTQFAFLLATPPARGAIHCGVDYFRGRCWLAEKKMRACNTKARIYSRRDLDCVLRILLGTHHSPLMPCG